MVPDHDPHFAGIFTDGAIEQPMIAEADLLIGVGLDPVELMWAAELLTAVRERLRVITIVFSDASLSLIEINQATTASARVFWRRAGHD